MRFRISDVSDIELKLILREAPSLNLFIFVLVYKYNIINIDINKSPLLLQNEGFFNNTSSSTTHKKYHAILLYSFMNFNIAERHLSNEAYAFGFVGHYKEHMPLMKFEILCFFP